MNGNTWDARSVTLDAAKWAAWAEPGEDAATAAHLDRLKCMPDRGALADVGAGWGRLAIPMAASRPEATVWAVDVSRTMLGHLAAQDASGRVRGVWCDGHAVPARVPALDGAWSVLMLQHVPHWVQYSYLRGIAERLRRGAPLVVQYVHTADPGPLSHATGDDLMLHWCARLGLAGSVEREPGRPWSWLHATKGS